MSPKEYFSLLFKCFFKILSLEKEVKEWGKIERVKTVSWVNFYNFLLAYSCVDNISLDNLYWFYGVFLGSIVGILYRAALGISFSNFYTIFIVFTNLIIFKIGIFTSTSPYIMINIVIGLNLGILLSVIYSFLVSQFSNLREGNYIRDTIILAIGGVLFLAISRNNEERLGTLFIVVLVSTYLLVNGRFWYFLNRPLYNKSNPLWWDENIGMPVPFLSQILRRYALTKDFDKTIEFTKFLIEERPVQRKAGQRSLILIALDRLKSFKSLKEIREISSALDFIPPPILNIEWTDEIYKFSLSESIFTLGEKKVYLYVEAFHYQLKPFLSLSEDINKTVSELNYSNRINIYERSQQQLIDYRKAANLSNSPFAQNFGEVADAWQKVLTKTIDDLRAGGKLPIANPYTLGKALQADSEQFLGRRDIIQKIETETLRAGAATALLFIGNRRTGKSSTLNNLQRFVQSAVRTVFADLQDAEVTNSTADFCETLTERIAKSLRLPTPSEPIRDLAAFTKWLKQRDADLVRDNRYLLICIDEYERLEGMIKQGKLADLPDSLRHWIQHLQHIVFLFAGSHEPSELKGDLDWTDYLINVRNVPISYLEYEAAMQLVTMPVPNFDLTWKTDDLADKLVLRLGRQPYLLQCTMWNLVENLNNQSRKEATQADIEQALDKVLEGDARNHFSHFWDTEMTDATRQLLSNLARNTPPTEGSVLNSLKRKEIVKQENGAYIFCVPLLKEWILRNVDAV